MKLQAIAAPAEIILKNGSIIDIAENLTMREHVENARKLGATKVVFRGSEHFIK